MSTNIIASPACFTTDDMSEYVCYTQCQFVSPTHGFLLSNKLRMTYISTEKSRNIL